MCESNIFTYTWKLENFRFNLCDVNDSLESPLFHALSLFGTGWSLRLFPRGNDSSCQYTSCFLHRSGGCGPEKITIQFEFAIVGKDGLPLLPWKSQFQTFKRGELSGWGNIRLWKNSLLLSKEDIYFPDGTFTVQCCLSLQHDAALYSCVDTTVFEYEKRSFQRSIENVSKFANPGHTVDIKLPFFDSFDMVVSSVEDENEYLSTCIRRGQKNDKRYFVMMGKVSLLDQEGSPKVSIHGDYHFKAPNSEWKFSLINFKKLQKEKLLIDDTLTLLFELSLSDGRSISESKTSDMALQLRECEERDSQLNKLVEDFKGLRGNNNEYSDITVRCGEEVHPVHRGILCARSPVFRRMIQADFLEKKNGEIVVKDLDSPTVKNFLDYIYFGKTECKNMDEIMSLLDASEKFDVPFLKQACSNTMMENITVDNVCGILLMADRYRLFTVKKRALKFIQSHSSEVLASESWTRLIRADVKLELEVRRIIQNK